MVADQPMMANPSEYHTMMYELFWNGNVPQQRQTKDGKAAPGTVTPAKVLKEYEQLLAKRQADPEKVAKRRAAALRKAESQAAAKAKG